MGKIRKLTVAFICMLLCLSFGISVSADVVIPFDVRPQLQRMNLSTGENEIRPMGTLLASGSSAVTDLGGGKVRFYGSTTCYRVCDAVTCKVYLYRKKSNGNWVSVTNTALVTKNNTSTASASKETTVTKGYYYYASGSHSAQKGSTVESMTSTCGSVYIG